MKESQLRQLIREEIKKTKKEVNELLPPDPVSLDPMVIGKIITGLALLLGGRAAVKSALEQAIQGEGPLSGFISPETAEKILSFFEGFSRGGGRG